MKYLSLFKYFIAFFLMLFTTNELCAQVLLSHHDNPQINAVMKYVSQSSNGDLGVEYSGRDVNIIQREPMNTIESLDLMLLTRFIRVGSEYKRSMNRFYKEGERVVVDENGDVIFLQIVVTNNDTTKMFSKLNKLKYVSLVSDGDNVTVDLTSNSEVKEIFLNYGSINDLILPIESKVEVLGTIRGDFESLSNLNKQESLLSLRINSDVSNISELNDNSSILRLSVFHNNKKTSGLKVTSLTELLYLSIFNYDESDLKEIDKMEHLRVLIFNGVNLRDVTLPRSLESFIFAFGREGNLPMFHEKNNLIEMRLTNIPIESISFFENAKKIERLSIRKSPINKIIGIDNLVNLKRLTIEETEIKKIESIGGIERLDKLKKIELGLNKIDSIKELSKIKSCDYIYIGFNEINKDDIVYINEWDGCRIFLEGNPIYDNANPKLKKKLIGLSRTK